MKDPFAARIADGRLYARLVAAVSDEEVASLGTGAVLETLTADVSIVCEPTELDAAVAHGFAGFEIETHGVAAHGSRPDLGVDAIVRMGEILVGLETLDRRLQEGRHHPLLGSGSVHASLIEGGTELPTRDARRVRARPGARARGLVLAAVEQARVVGLPFCSDSP